MSDGSDAIPEQSVQSAQPVQSGEDYFGPKIALVAICAFLFVLFLYGGCITGLVLKEPDICFLLGGGRWIVEHGQIPATDPFSYTTHYHWAQYVIEKWLTEVIFFGIESSLGLVALLVFDAIVLTVAFVVIPYRIVHLAGWRGGAAMGLVLLALLTSCSHLAVRPEIFSFIFAGIWLEVLIRINAATEGNSRIQWRFIALLGVLMCLWSNMHTLFMVGILLPGFYSACAIAERFIPGLKEKPFNWTGPILTVVCILASLVNPWGIGLWTYMPNVFGPFNDTNNEMQPINIRNGGNPFFFPFYILVFLSLKAFVKEFRKPLRHGDLFFRGLVPLGVLGGMKTVRSIPLADLFLVAGRAKLRPLDEPLPAASGAAPATSADLLSTADAVSSSSTAPPEAAVSPAAVSETSTAAPDALSPLARLTNPFSYAWPSMCITAAAVGAYVLSFSVKPEVPQGSAAFHPPIKAIEYIDHHRPSGNLLNDPHFGAVMIYKMRNNPPVFIDPRYNLYGNDLLQDYWHMVKCDDGYEALLNKYQIAWVFVPPKLELPKRLAQNPEWQLLYSDDDSVIYAKKKSVEGNSITKQ